MKRYVVDISIPDEDAAEFSVLPLAARREFLAWKHELGLAMNEHGNLGARLERCAKRMGVSYQTARRKWDGARHRGWRGVVDGRREARASEAVLPPEFLEFWRALCEKENRSCRQAWKRLLVLWHAGQDIPGYSVAPPPGMSGLPDGWSYANLMRHAPTQYELKSVRIGRSAADANRPLMMATRVGLPVGKVYMFDDVWHDIMVNWVGVAREAIRPLEMCAIDVASSAKVAWGLRPRLTREDGTRTNLNEHDMRLLVTAVLVNCGYRADGTLLTVEHGTAAIRPGGEFAVALDAVTGGAVRVVRGGIKDAPLILGGWPGAKRGNFRLKASLESLHNLSHNALGLLPGQTGSNSRENQPEALSAIEKYNNGLLKEVDGLPEDRVAEIAAKLEFPLLHWHDYAGIVGDVYRWIDRRTLHALEGWEANGWTMQEYRHDPSDKRWLPAAGLRELPEHNRAVVLASVQRPGCMRIRKLSPAEVWHQGHGELIKLRPEHVPLLLGPDLAAVKRMDRNGVFNVQGHEWGGGDPLRFPAARVTNVLGQEVLLNSRADYKVFANPFDLSMLYVCDMDLRYIGYARRQVGVSRAAIDAIHRAIGASDRDRTARTAGVRARHAVEARERAAMLEHNDEVLGTITGGTLRPIGARGKPRISAADDALLAEMVEDEPEAEVATADIADLI